MKKIFLISFIIVFILVNCSSESSIIQAFSGELSRAEYRLSEMTLREKIGQMIISYTDGYELTEESKEYQRLKILITEDKIGGLVVFKGNALQEALLLNKLQKLAETPLLISQDFERGTGMRLDDGSIYPNNMAIGATRNSELAYKMGLLIAKECRAIGVHQNYSPVVDVNNNPSNPIINVRSFGENPGLVSDLGIAMIKGLQDGGVIATAKHFPGHGDTDIDSHNDLPEMKFDIERLRKTELPPFKSAIENGVMSVMAAHVSLPIINNYVNLPASLSKSVVNDILIEELGFNGLIITDALNMDGIKKNFPTSDVALLCINAGIDLILMPQGERETIEAIAGAVESGSISEERINKSVIKILEKKEFLKLNENKFVDINNVLQSVNSVEEQELSQKIANLSITLVKNDERLIPFKKDLRDNTCVMLHLKRQSEISNSQYFFDEFSRKLKPVFGTVIKLITVNDEIDYIEKLHERVSEYDYIIIPIFAKVQMKTGTVGIPESHVDLINMLAHSGKKVIVISFGNPYLLKDFEDVPVYMCAYGDGNTSINAAINTLTGENNPSGRLPVTISNNFKFGFGLKY
jgi:beta-N-acetylhexosaminidase